MGNYTSGLFFLLLGGTMICLGISIRRKTLTILRTGLRTTATVVALGETTITDQRGASPRSLPQVKVRWRDREGMEREGTHMAGSLKLSVGDPVEIAYRLPGDPGSANAEVEFELLAQPNNPFGCFLFGVLAFLVGSALLVTSFWPSLTTRWPSLNNFWPTTP